MMKAKVKNNDLANTIQSPHHLETSLKTSIKSSIEFI